LSLFCDDKALRRQDVFQILFAPKGRHMKAQGIALGFGQRKRGALNGRHAPVSPLQGDENRITKTQGCALGFQIVLLRSG
jgi:hypothetical protein